MVRLILTGFLLASILIFSITALPEIVPFFSPALKTGVIVIDVTSSSARDLEGDRIYVLVDNIEFHRVGVSEGRWVKALSYAERVDLVEASRGPERLAEAQLPIGQYNLARISLGNGSLLSAGSEIDLRIPSNIPQTPVNFMVTENTAVSLLLDIAFDEGAIYVLHMLHPYLYMVVKQPTVEQATGADTLTPMASFGPETRGPGGSSTFTFEIPNGGEVEGYLLYVKGGASGRDAFDVQVQDTAEFWHNISGEGWFLGGNLTAGSHTIVVHVSELASRPVTFMVKIFRVPRMPSDLSRPSFRGVSYAQEFPGPPINEVAVYFETAGAYNIYLTVESGDYDFLADKDPISFVNSNRTVTLELSVGFHSFQVLPDYSGSGRDTAWMIVVTHVPITSGPSLSPMGIMGTLLLVAAGSAYVVNLALARIIARRIEGSASRSTNR